MSVHTSARQPSPAPGCGLRSRDTGTAGGELGSDSADLLLQPSGSWRGRSPATSVLRVPPLWCRVGGEAGKGAFPTQREASRCRWVGPWGTLFRLCPAPRLPPQGKE